MAANTLKKLFQFTLTTTNTVIYIAPGQKRVSIIALYKTNVSASDRTFRLHQVNAGANASIADALYYDEPITTKRVHPRIDTGIILEPGQSIQGLASAASAVTITGFGIESEEE